MLKNHKVLRGRWWAMMGLCWNRREGGGTCALLWLVATSLSAPQWNSHSQRWWDFSMKEFNRICLHWWESNVKLTHVASVDSFFDKTEKESKVPLNKTHWMTFVCVYVVWQCCKYVQNRVCQRACVASYPCRRLLNFSTLNMGQSFFLYAMHFYKNT